MRVTSSFSSFSTTHYIMLLILLWQFTNSLLFYLFLEPAYVLMMMDIISSTEVILVEATLSSLSIVAGILADLKFGRYTVLRMSAHFMIVFEIGALISWILMSVIVTTVDYKFYIILTLTISEEYFLLQILFSLEQISFETCLLPSQTVIFILYYLLKNLQQSFW